MQNRSREGESGHLKFLWQSSMTWQPFSRYHSLANVDQHVPVHANLSHCLLPWPVFKKKSRPWFQHFDVQGVLGCSEIRSDLVELRRKGLRQRRKEGRGGCVKQPVFQSGLVLERLLGKAKVMV